MKLNFFFGAVHMINMLFFLPGDANKVVYNSQLGQKLYEGPCGVSCSLYETTWTVYLNSIYSIHFITFNLWHDRTRLDEVFGNIHCISIKLQLFIYKSLNYSYFVT